MAVAWWGFWEKFEVSWCCKGFSKLPPNHNRIKSEINLYKLVNTINLTKNFTANYQTDLTHVEHRGDRKTKSLKVWKKTVWYQCYCWKFRSSLSAWCLIFTHKLLIHPLNLWNKRSKLTVFIPLSTKNQQL